MSMEAVAEVQGHVLNRSNSGGVMNWLGDVPDGWSLLANKYIFKLRKALVGKRHAEHELLSLTLNGIIKRDMENPEGKFPAEFDTYQVVRPGDFVFCLFDVEETPRTVGFSRHHGMITGAYTVLELQEGFDGAFLYYFYLNLDSGKRLRHLYRGLRNTIPKETFFGFKSFIPPLPEQTRIAAFLDRKCGQIDQAIAQKERLIALLKERRQVLVQKAVTKGLDPKAKMKDSGVGWLGEVPAHWEVRRLKYVVQVLKRIAGELGHDVLSITQKGIKVKDIESNEGQIALDYTNYQRVYKGEFAMNHMDLITGYVDISKYDGVLSPDYRVFKPITADIHDPYLLLLFQMCYKNRIFYPYGQGVSQLGRWRFPAEAFNDFLIPLPPMAEQQAIAEYLTGQSSKEEAYQEKLEASIAKLKEYRSILINAAVTGKIKVPEV